MTQWGISEFECYYTREHLRHSGLWKTISSVKQSRNQRAFNSFKTHYFIGDFQSTVHYLMKTLVLHQGYCGYMQKFHSWHVTRTSINLSSIDKHNSWMRGRTSFCYNAVVSEISLDVRFASLYTDLEEWSGEKSISYKKQCNTCVTWYTFNRLGLKLRDGLMTRYGIYGQRFKKEIWNVTTVNSKTGEDLNV